MPKIYDNIHCKFADGLSAHMASALRVDYCSGYFNLRGWNMVSSAVDVLPGAIVAENEAEVRRYCRLLVGMTNTPQQELIEQFANPNDLLMDNEKANRARKKLAIEFSEQLTYGLPTQEDEYTLQKLLRQLRSGKVVVKLYLRHKLHAKLYLAHSQIGLTPVVGLLGSSNFTFAGLSKQGELNIDVLEQDAAAKLSDWFEDRWNDRWCIDITADLISVIENSWARPDLIPPYYIYLKMAYHLSREARAGLAEYTIAREFRDTLLDFQQAAVKIAAHHLNKRNGVIVGDVVGLGKTIVATAVAKIMEDDLYYNTLILCPKNLVSMWRGYVEKYGLHAQVISHSMITRDLPSLKRYKLVIVDESHNFRNNLGDTYRALRAYIQENESKVILLSATPYNKSYSDLSNQLKLFLPEDFDLGIKPELYIKSLLPGNCGTDVDFVMKHTDTNIRTINAFEKSEYADDWREVMKLYLVRRTRSFIKNNYAKTDELDGRKYLLFSDGTRSYFPDRHPKRVDFALDENDPKDQYATLYAQSTVMAISSLNLPRYGLHEYRDSGKNAVNPTGDEKRILENLSRAGKRVIGFCKTNLYKRLESSGYSFLLSLSRHILRNEVFIYAISNGLDLPVSGQSVNVDFYTDADNEAGLQMDFSLHRDDYKNKAKEYYDEFSTAYRKKFEWLRCGLFDTTKLLRELKEDTDNLFSILTAVKKWVPENDRKIAALCDLITNKHRNDKLLIFTQFADTAEYIDGELRKIGIKKAAVALGGSDNIVELVGKFSPVSNEKAIPKDEQLRVLITTDVLSEGQNLQDAHIVVNFDLPWAIVRLIQRAGRVDRLGQTSPQILCYSFLPEDGIERIIGLRSKLKTRIKENAEVVGSDEVFFDGDPVNISDLYSEKSGILDEGSDDEVDLASYAYQIWKNATDDNPALKTAVENLPNVVFSTRENDTEHAGNSVIVYARTKDDNDSMAWIDEDGNIVTQSQYRILNSVRCAIDTPALPKLEAHHTLVRAGVDQIQQETVTTSGTLGRKSSVKYRTYKQLERFYNENEGTLFVPPNLKFALDQIFQYPMKENAIDRISRQMRAGASEYELANLVDALYIDQALCTIEEDKPENIAASIICSLGLSGGVV